MSLTKKLQISVDLVNTTNAIREIKSIKKEVEELQSAANKVQVRVNAHEQNRAKSEKETRMQNREAAVNRSTIGLPIRKNDPFGTQFLRRNTEADVEEFLGNFRKIQDRKYAYEKEALNDPFGSRFLSKPLNEKVAARIDARDKGKYYSPNVSTLGHVGFEDKAYKMDYTESRYSLNQRIRANYANIQRLSDEEVKAYKNVVQVAKARLNSAKFDKDSAFSNSEGKYGWELKSDQRAAQKNFLNAQESFRIAQDQYDNLKANISTAVGANFNTNLQRKYYKHSLSSALNGVSGPRNTINTLMKDPKNTYSFEKYSQLQDELHSVSGERYDKNADSNRFYNLRKGQIQSEIDLLVSKNPALQTANSAEAELQSQYTAIRRNQAKISKLYSNSAQQRVSAEQNAFAAIDRMNLESTVFTQKEQAKKTRITQQEVERRLKAEEDATREAFNSAQRYFQTGFSMHILGTYLNPMLQSIRAFVKESLQVFSEFDKKFVDYTVKSADYSSVLDRDDFYNIAKGKTFGLTNSAITAERFAASGIDVAKSQEALTSTMQVSTLAELDYDKAANGVIRTMQSMHMQINQTTQITDAMINSANASSAELSDLVDWFEYSASAAYQLGLNVQDLSKYLGILSSTGTPGTGAAARQLFLQLQKQDIKDKFKSQFGLSEEDVTDFNKFIEAMRSQADASGDKKAFTTKALQILEGKANAQLALNNLIMAEPELWNRIDAAVQKTGTTQDLYNKATLNTADALKKVATNVEILKVQFGGAFSFVANVLLSLSNALVTISTAIPEPIRKGIGAILAVGGAMLTLITVVLSGIGFIAILKGTVILLKKDLFQFSLTAKDVVITLRELWIEVKRIVFANKELATSFSTVSTSMNAVNTSTFVGKSAITAWQGALTAVSGGMIGYMASSELLQEQMYAEAELVNHLTAGYMALQIMRAGSFNPASILAGTAVWFGYEELMNQKLENIKREQRIAKTNAAISGSNQTVNKTYNMNFANVNMSTEGIGVEDLADYMDSSDLDE